MVSTSICGNVPDASIKNYILTDVQLGYVYLLGSPVEEDRGKEKVYFESTAKSAQRLTVKLQDLTL